MRTIKICICLLSVIITLFYIIKYIANDVDFCLDTGYCKEGLSLNTEFGQIIVNQENCINNSGIWISNKKYCKFK